MTSLGRPAEQSVVVMAASVGHQVATALETPRTNETREFENRQEVTVGDRLRR